MLAHSISSIETIFNNLLNELSSKSDLDMSQLFKIKSLNALQNVAVADLENVIQKQLSEKSKFIIYQALQKIFEHEMQKCFDENTFNLIMDFDKKSDSTPDKVKRLKALEQILIKNFGFAGYITQCFLFSIGEEQARFSAMQVLCLAQLMLNQFPRDESIELVNNYFNNFFKQGDDNHSVPVLENKEGQIYFGGELLSEAIKLLSSLITQNEELSSTIIEKAYKLAETRLSKLQLTHDETVSLKKSNSKDSTAQLLATFTPQSTQEEAKMSFDSKIDPSNKEIDSKTAGSDKKDNHQKTEEIEKRPSFSL